MERNEKGNRSTTKSERAKGRGDDGLEKRWPRPRPRPWRRLLIRIDRPVSISLINLTRFVFCLVTKLIISLSSAVGIRYMRIHHKRATNIKQSNNRDGNKYGPISISIVSHQNRQQGARWKLDTHPHHCRPSFCEPLWCLWSSFVQTKLICSPEFAMEFCGLEVIPHAIPTHQLGQGLVCESLALIT